MGKKQVMKPYPYVEVRSHFLWVMGLYLIFILILAVFSLYELLKNNIFLFIFRKKIHYAYNQTQYPEQMMLRKLRESVWSERVKARTQVSNWVRVSLVVKLGPYKETCPLIWRVVHRICNWICFPGQLSKPSLGLYDLNAEHTQGRTNSFPEDIQRILKDHSLSLVAQSLVKPGSLASSLQYPCRGLDETEHTDTHPSQWPISHLSLQAGSNVGRNEMGWAGLE